jgi:Acetamidase/Formamidase family
MKGLTLNYDLRCAEPTKGHNRWHCDVTPALEVGSGEEIERDTMDTLDGQVTASTTAEDLRKADLNQVHPLTSPVFVKGAFPIPHYRRAPRQLAHARERRAVQGSRQASFSSIF